MHSPGPCGVRLLVTHFDSHRGDRYPFDGHCVDVASGCSTSCRHISGCGGIEVIQKSCEQHLILFEVCLYASYFFDHRHRGVDRTLVSTVTIVTSIHSLCTADLYHSHDPCTNRCPIRSRLMPSFRIFNARSSVPWWTDSIFSTNCFRSKQIRRRTAAACSRITASGRPTETS